MKVNDVPFFTSISRVVSFGSAMEIPSTDMDNVMVALAVILGKYRARGSECYQ